MLEHFVTPREPEGPGGGRFSIVHFNHQAVVDWVKAKLDPSSEYDNALPRSKGTYLHNPVVAHFQLTLIWLGKGFLYSESHREVSFSGILARKGFVDLRQMVCVLDMCIRAA
jgi:hypothetical protein